MPAEDVRTVRSFCRICTSVCGILVEVDGDVVTRVRGDREHPLSHGYTCPKGRALPQMHHHPDRIERPQMRIDGQLRDTSWEACLDDLGARIRSVIERHGPGSVGIFFGTGVGMDATGTRVAEALHAAIGTPAKFSPLTIDGTAKPLISDLVGGFVGTVRPTRLRQRRLHGVRRHQPGDLARSRDRRTESHWHRARRSPSVARCGSSIHDALKRPDWQPATSRRDPAPTTPCWRTWCAKSSATAPIPTCECKTRSCWPPLSSRLRSRALRNWPTSRPTSWCDSVTRCEPPIALRSKRAPA